MGIANCDDIEALTLRVAELESAVAALTDDIPEFADNAAALTGGLTVGDRYRTGDLLKVVH